MAHPTASTKNGNGLAQAVVITLLGALVTAAVVALSAVFVWAIQVRSDVAVLQERVSSLERAILNAPATPPVKH